MKEDVEMLRVAIIGLGNIARVHLEGIACFEDAVLVAGCDINPAQKSLLPIGTAFYTSFEEMLVREKPDVVHICLPHFLHYPAAKAAAAHGCHIFTEKPLALNSLQAEACAGLAHQYGIKMCLCMQNRLNNTTQALLPLLKNKKYGKITGLRAIVPWHRTKDYYQSSPWRGRLAEAGGGCMINQALHTLDLLRLFAGSPARQVSGLTGNLLNYGVEVEDTCIATLCFENNVDALFTATLANSQDDDVEMQIRCEKAVFALRHKTLSVNFGQSEEILAEDSSPTVGKNCYGSSHSRLIAQFYTGIIENTDNYIEPEEGIEVLQIIEAIQQSSKTGKPVALR